MFLLKNHQVPIFLLLFYYTAQSQSVITYTFQYTGATQTFVMPYCSSELTVVAAGGPGGNGNWGISAAATMSCQMTSTPGQLLYINVGGNGTLLNGGWNGGGNGGVGTSSVGGGGGGATDIRLGNNLIGSRILVMGGGGGSSSCWAQTGSGGDAFAAPFNCTTTAYLASGGGGGWGTVPAYNASCTGANATGYGVGGGGGGITSGGGIAGSLNGSFGQAGTLGQGGNGGGAIPVYGGSASGIYGAGGGGGGYFGGAGGMSGNYQEGFNYVLSGGGGAGSSYVDNSIFYNCISGGVYAVPFPGFLRISFSYTSPVVSASAPSLVCTGNAATLNASGVSTYTWWPVGSFTGSSGSSVVVTPPSFTSYSVSGTNSAGCTSAIVLTIDPQSSSPTISVVNSSSSGSICPGSTLNLTATGVSSYTWFPAFVNPLTFTSSLQQTYTVSGSNGCGTTSATTTINVLPAPVVSIVASPQASVCEGGGVSLSGSGASTYTWVNPGISSGVSFTPAITSTFTLAGTSALGCTAIATGTVLVVPFPTITPIASPATICVGGSVQLSASGAASYTWIGLNSNLPTLTLSPPGSTTYVVQEANSNCSVSFSIPVTVNALPQPTAQASSTLNCAGYPTTLTATGNFSNQWWTGTQTITGQAVTVYPSVNTTYTLKSTDNNNCSNTTTISLGVLPSPTITIAASSNSICSGQNAILQASGALTYSWNNSLPATGQVIVNPAFSTQFVVSGTNSLGCVSTQSIVILVSPSPTINLTTTGSLVCAGHSVTVIANGANNYFWSNGINGYSISVSPSVTSVYTVTGTYPSGCSSSSTIQINHYSPNISITGPSVACVGTTFTLVPSPAGIYSWSGNYMGSQYTGVVNTTTVIYLLANTATSGIVCSSTHSHSIVAIQNPTLAVSAPSKICEGENTVLSVSGAISYTWNGLPGANTFTYFSGQNTFITVSGINSNSCVTTETLQVNVQKCTRLQEFENDRMMVFPNPSVGRFIISSDRYTDYIIFWQDSNIVAEGALKEENDFKKEFSFYRNGVYMVKYTCNGISAVKKIVVIAE